MFYLSNITDFTRFKRLWKPYVNRMFENRGDDRNEKVEDACCLDLGVEIKIFGLRALYFPISGSISEGLSNPAY